MATANAYGMNAKYLRYFSLLCAPYGHPTPGGCLYGQQPPRSRLRNFRHFLHTTPLCRNHEQRSFVRASEHTSKAAPISVDRLQHLTTFADAHATLIGNVRIPDATVGVDANAVGNAVVQVCPYVSLR